MAKEDQHIIDEQIPLPRRLGDPIYLVFSTVLED
jgi:hypothetical protein